ncbi:NADH-FMN oxidoreductase RutF, flavin reductase (DIM6/NTAB) family [Plantibacter flavus]|uniref:Flavin reductase (DIM6/NTAB) family NADH-FMN oxidoreductase RutF n=1 Tax=Plantibacter flavus TaxID=150123 RepID=A0A3N2C109_9MICO|nr:flavin reductase (DIM6/NTAB) family NADH-FMN oxidoreductase RutF [Plantibacter flavus]SMG09067.1 NADH-FMN oxidoreductase RutF, flavin reductase (DIM6/NTAB) family [Plantibacter flavus]
MSSVHPAAASVTALPSPVDGGEVAPGFASLSPDDFKAAFRQHPAGVSVITADDGSGPVGLTATSVFSVSAEPPLLVFSVSSLSSSAPTITASDTVVVHLLGSEQLHIAKLCATSGIDRFADTSIWDRLPTGEPYFTGNGVWIRGRIVNRMEAGTSTVIAVHALESSVSQPQAAEEPVRAEPAAEAPTPAVPTFSPSFDGAPLVYHNRTWHRLDANSQIDG